MRRFPVLLDPAGRPASMLDGGRAADTEVGFLSRAGASRRRPARFPPGPVEGCAVAVVGAGAPEEGLRTSSAACRSIPRTGRGCAPSPRPPSWTGRR